MFTIKLPRAPFTSILWAAALALVVTALPAGAARTVRVVAPAAEETVHDNSGNVRVMVSLDSDLLRGQVLQPLVDGRPFGPPRQSREFTLEGLDRGAHTLQVQLLDGQGNVLAASPAVTFYQWQASRLNPAR